MKKQILFLSLFLCIGLGSISNAQVCSLDTFTIPGIYPDTLVNLPKGYTNSAYGTVIQIRVFPDTMSPGGNVHVTDIQVNSVTGMPAGFSYACNPGNCAFPGGGNGCIYLSGTATTGQAGLYNLIVNVTLHGKLLGIIPVTQASQILGYKIQILDAPVADFSGSVTTLCKGETVSYSDLTSNSPASWSWSFPGGTPSTSTLQNPVVTYNSAGAHNVSLTSSNPAGNNTKTKNSYVVVNSPPTASISVTGSLTLCSGSTVLFNSNTGSGYTYQWIRNGVDLPGATLSSYQANAGGAYKVRVTKANGCSKISSPKTVTVSTVTATVTAGGPTTFCSGDNVLLTGSSANGISWQWRKSGVDISGATGSTYSALSSGAYKVIVTNSSGCTKSSNVINVTSNALPTSTFTANGPLTFCAGGNVLFTASSGVNYSYQWKKAGNNIPGATAVTYQANTAGIYKVRITNTVSGCSKTSSGKTVTVNCKASNFNTSFSDVSNIKLYPNPGHASGKTVTLTFSLSENKMTAIGIFNLHGQLVSKIKDQHLDAGDQIIELPVDYLSPGLYLVRIRTTGSSQILKMTISSD